MDSSLLLAVDVTAETSETFSVAAGEIAVISAITTSGVDVKSGPVLTVHRIVDSTYMTFSVKGGGHVLCAGAHQVVITAPGDYVISRPDISAWEFPVGAELLITSTRPS